MEVNENTNEKNAFVPKYKQSVIKYQKSILEEYNLDKIGTIRYAKIHSSANRPLKKKKEKILIEAPIFVNVAIYQKNNMEFWKNLIVLIIPTALSSVGGGIPIFYLF